MMVASVLLTVCGIIAAIMLAWLLILQRCSIYRWMHRHFWCAVDRSLHFAMDHLALGGTAWHRASFMHWAAHELAHYTRPNRKARR